MRMNHMTSSFTADHARNRLPGIIAITLMFISPLAVHADDDAPDSSSPNIQRALDQPMEALTLSGKTVPEVIAELAKRAGIRINLDEDAVELLPWGRETKVADLKIENATVREALNRVLGALGLAVEERGADLMVVPTAPLARMNRRATWDDLKLLRLCNDTEFSPEALSNLKFQYRISSKVDAPGLLSTQLGKAGQGSVAQMLEAATGSLGWTWFPNGDHIVIMTMEAQYAHRLARRVTVRYNNTPLAGILVDLAKRANVALFLEPGMMLKLPHNTAQSYTLSLQQSSIRQAFEVICAETGLKYDIERDGIRVGMGESSSSISALSNMAQQTNYVGKISIPSKDGSFAYEFLVRANELPKDILEYRKQIIQAVIEKMRGDMAPDNAIKPGDQMPGKPPSE